MQNLIIFVGSMIERVRDGNQGFVINGSGTSQQMQATSPFFGGNSHGQEDLDEGEMNFVPFEHTQFSKDNTRAMALLIILFER